jgi:hypothetical protein
MTVCDFRIVFLPVAVFPFVGGTKMCFDGGNTCLEGIDALGNCVEPSPTFGKNFAI